MRGYRLPFSLAFGVLIAAAGPGASQGLPCLTNADTAARHIEEVTAIVAEDSIRLVQQGLPYRPAAGVALVTDSITCRSLVDAHNAGLAPTDPGRISAAYVMRVGTSIYAMVGDALPDIYYFRDAAYQILAAMVGMH
jgi:hypothetical protein